VSPRRAENETTAESGGSGKMNSACVGSLTSLEYLNGMARGRDCCNGYVYN
jgi:hypothetical protein